MTSEHPNLSLIGQLRRCDELIAGGDPSKTAILHLTPTATFVIIACLETLIDLCDGGVIGLPVLYQHIARSVVLLLKRAAVEQRFEMTQEAAAELMQIMRQQQSSILAAERAAIEVPNIILPRGVDLGGEHE